MFTVLALCPDVSGKPTVKLFFRADDCAIVAVVPGVSGPSV